MSSAHVSRGIVFGEHSASFVIASSGGTGEEKARVAPLPRGKGASRIALLRTFTGLAGNTAQLANGRERAESRSSDVLSQLSGLRRALALRAILANGSTRSGSAIDTYPRPRSNESIDFPQSLRMS